MSRDFELKAQLAILGLKADVVHAIEETKALRRTQVRMPKAEVDLDELEIQKRRAKAIARAKSQRSPHRSRED